MSIRSIHRQTWLIQIKVQAADFTDLPEQFWAADLIRDAAARGWIKGYGDGSFRAEQKITRAEVVTIVNRLLDRTADQRYIDSNPSGLLSFSDLDKSHWAFYDVMESANTHTARRDDGETWEK